MFSHRATQMELMDDLSRPDSEFADAYRELAIINRRLGGVRAIRRFLSRDHNSVLDVEDMSLRDATGAQQIALLEARTQERIQLDEALRRLDEGTYGICEDCEEAISPARLRALPFARRCVTCQEQYELFEHIMRREDREEL